MLTCLNFSHPQSTLHLMQYTYWDVFPTAQNNFWTHWFWCLLVFLPFFSFHLFYIGKMFPFEDFFIQGNKKNVDWGEIWWLGRVGDRGHAIFGQKLLNTQHGVGRCVCKSPIMKWANTLKVFKKFTEAECSLSGHCQLIHWYRWVPRTLM